ncbi:Translocase of chloroplast 34, chloroplastic [Capsicum baccatum]|uniref:Translocase of chloroplast 34, chloroplastic n=1 Tax=Capsicum baccatum TaxID=33114 RepID=A0A2G2WTP9_CAPBA|nr:Translocase of chloroplast 34, chloroplastic [Capsicum baccatum]
MHLINFISTCNSFDNPGVGQNAIRLRLFPLSLSGEATLWLNGLTPDSITNWRQLKDAFLERFFPPSKKAQLRDEISNFRQLPTEALHETWERFKKKLMRCPNHHMTNVHLMEILYRALNSVTKPVVDNSAGGSFMDLTFNEASGMLNRMTKQSRAWHTRDSEVASSTISIGMTVEQRRREEERDQDMAHIKTQMDLLTKHLLSGKTEKVKTVASKGRDESDSEEEANYLNNQGGFRGNAQGNQGRNYYDNSGNKDRDQGSWKNKNDRSGVYIPPGRCDATASGFENMSMEDMMAKLLKGVEATNTGVTEVINDLSSMKQLVDSHSTLIKQLEQQLSQLSATFNQRKAGTLPSNTVQNPKNDGTCMAITTRSGKVLETSSKGTQVINAEPEGADEATEDLTINVPLVEVLEQIPGYAKFMKDLLTKKRAASYEPAHDIHHCSAIATRSLVQKKADPDFVILDCEVDFEVPIILGCPFLATGSVLIDMRANELLFRLNDEVVRFDVCKAMKQPSDMNVFSVDDACYEDEKNLFVEKQPIDEPLSAALLNVEHEDDEDYKKTMCALTEIGSYSHTPKQPNLDLKNQPSPTAKTSIEEPLVLESKELPNYLRYAFLGSGNTLPVSVADDLSEQHVETLISALKRCKKAMGWTINDIIGIPPGICMHKSHINEDCMPTKYASIALTCSKERLHVWKRDNVKLSMASQVIREWVGFQQFPSATQSKLLELIRKSKQERRNTLTVLVMGKGGVGKSSTVNSILGERAVTVSAFQSEIPRPVMVSRSWEEFTLNIIDTPGLVEGGYVNDQALDLIKRFLLNKTIDVLLYVDRLDSYRVDNLDRQVVKAITDSFGKEIWRRGLVVLTHAQVSPPDGLSYDEFTLRRSEALLKIVRLGARIRKQEVKVEGDGTWVVEPPLNSHHSKMPVPGTHSRIISLHLAPLPSCAN